MKKLVFTIMLMLATFFMNAQNTHWPQTSGNQYSESINAELYLNGESMRLAPDAQYYEIGAFVGDECRGTSLAAAAPPFVGGYVHYLTVGSNVTQGETVTFRLYNHQTEEEMAVICNTTINFVADGSLGTLLNLFHIEFVEDTTPRYSITVAANPVAGGTVTGAGTYTEGSSCTIAATPNAAYNFVNWTKNGSVVSTNASYTFDVMEAGDYVANFSMKTLNITTTADPQSYGSVSGGGTYNYGSTVTLTATPNTGYIFFNWTKNGQVVSTDATYTFTATDGVAGQYVAHFATRIFTITASANPAAGGSVSGAGQIQEGQTCTLVATPNIQYNFVKWTKNGVDVSTNPSYSFVVTGDAAYVAHFTIKQFVVTATSSNNSLGTVTGGGTFNYGATCTLVATPLADNLFVNWTKNGNVVSTDATYSFTAVDGTNGEYVANFAASLIYITATANPADAGTITGTGGFAEGNTCTLTATANPGYKFVNWTKNGAVVSTDPTYSFTVTAPASYVANFSAITLYWAFDNHMQYQMTATVELYLDGESLRYAENGHYYELAAFVGEECRGSYLPDEVPQVPFGGGYQYSMTIYSEATGGESVTFRLYNHQIDEEVQVICNTTLAFSANGNYGNAMQPYQVSLTTDPTPRYYVTTSINPAEGGTVEGAGRYREGDPCTLVATPNIAYNFVNWTKNGQVVSTNPNYTFTVMEEAEYVANFAIKTFAITVAAEPASQGSVSGAGTYEYGQTVTLTGTPNTGYIFFKWTKNGVEVSTDATYTFTAVDGVEGEYVGVFATKVYTITAAANPTSGGTVSGAGQIQEGQTCTLVATPNTGYNFVNWMKVTDDEGKGRTVEESLTYILDGSITGGTNSYTSASEITQDDKTWSVMGNTTMNPWRIGGKNLSNVNREVYCTSTFGDNITKVVVEHGTAANIIVNSVTLIVSANANFSNPTSTVTGTFAANSTTTFNRPVGADWTNKYFKIVYNVSVSGNTNRFFQFKKAEFYKEENNTPINGVVVSTDPTYSFTVVEDADYVANFELKSYDIAVTATPAAFGTVTGAGNYIYGSTCTITATPNENFIFANWTLNGEVISENATYTFVVNDETAGEYVGNFARSLYQITVTANPVAGGTVTGAGAYMEGQTVTLTATANTGYRFGNWTKDGEVVSEEATFSFVVADGVEGNYVANFDEITCHWTFNSHLEYQATATLELLIDGVSMRNNDDVVFYEIGIFVGDVCRGAYLPASAPPFLGGGYVYSTTYYSSQQQGETMHFRLYNHLTEEEVDLTCYTTLTFVSNTNTGSAQTPFAVNFVSIPSYDITVAANPEEGGTVTGAGTYLEGTEITLVATPGEIYDFVNWTLDGEEVSTDAEYTFTVMAAGDYVANFEYKYYDIAVVADPEDGGELEGDGTYMYGTECTILATPDEAYDFLYWAIDDDVVSEDPGYTFTVTGDATYTAYFELKTYEVTVTCDPVAAGHVLGAGTYVHGTTCTLTAAADDNNFFVNWTEDGEEVSRNASYSFTVTEDHELVANYLPYHWTAMYGEFPDVMGVVAVVEIEGDEQVSDMIEIAAFMGDECRGREKGIEVTEYGHTYYFLTITGEDGDIFDSYRLYNHETGEEYELYCFQEIEFEADGDMGDLDDPYVFEFTHMQTVELATGFNWFASYIELDGVDGWTMLTDAIGTSAERILSQNEYTMFYNYSGYELWYPYLTSMTPLNNESMYRIVMNEPKTIQLFGALADPEDHPITISQGMNHIGFVSSEPIALHDAFDDLDKGNFDMVKTQYSYATYYLDYDMWYGSMDDNTLVLPGQGMMYKYEGNETVSFTYPSASAKGTRYEKIDTDNNYWNANYMAYPTNMTVMAVVEFANEELASENYELGAFVNGECRGSIRLKYVEPIDRYVAFLTIAGDEATTVNLRLYNGETDEVYFFADNHIVYNADEMLGDFNNPFVVKFNSSSSELVVYPNPVNNGERLNVVLSSNGESQVDIINSVGMVVSSMITTGSEIVMDVPTTPGVYTIRVITEGKDVKCNKLIVK